MHHLPAGTITLLFTDIEGSTQLLQRLGDQYAYVLEESRRLQRAVFQRWNGYEVDTQGDAFFVAFARATDAVSAAVEAQRSLSTHAWPQGATVRVRMGLHTGEPLLASEGYVGMDVHQAARIMSAGHGGQVLISQVTRDLVEEHLPDGVSIRHMGERRLKDVQQPAHLFQLVAVGLPADFPPLKTLDASPNNLPVQSTPLVGREGEMVAIKQLLRRQDVHLVTLTGPGGIGKTRLALEVTADLSDLFADGVYFVDLAPVRDATLVIPIVTQALGLREEENISPLEHLKEKLRHKQMLLLLDNFEQVIDAAAEMADLLASCLQLKMIVTSRAVLHIRAEREFVVPPLTLPDSQQSPDPSDLLRYAAVALFIQRTQAVKPNFQLTAANAPAVVQIVARLDGLPLAIELAAARMKLLSPEALLARLGQRLQLLRSEARDVAARQQTLRNTIEWSYNLLDAQEQLLFRRLSVFVGGCQLSAVEAVCTMPGEEAGSILDCLTSLLDKSLLRQREQGIEPRFVMLETIREYGLEALSASGERETVRKAHASYFLALALAMEQALGGPDQVACLDRLEQEHGNLRAVMRWSLEQENREMALRLGGTLRHFWYMRGHFGEGLDFLEQALVRSEGADAFERAVVLHAAARMNELAGNIDRAELLVAESLALYQSLGNTTHIAYALHLQADIAWKRGKLSQARKWAEESLALFREMDDNGSIAGLLLHLGVLATDQGRYAQARALLDESLAINREVQDTSSVADSLFNLARMCFFAGENSAQVRSYLDESFALHTSLSDKESVAYCLHLFGLLAMEEGNITSARSLVEQAVTLFQALKQQHGTALSTTTLARVMAAQGDDAAAITLFRESITLAINADDKLNIVFSLQGLADVGARQGKLVWAARLWGAAEALRETIDAPVPFVERRSYERAVAEVHARLGARPFATNWTLGRGMTVEEALRSEDDCEAH